MDNVRRTKATKQQKRWCKKASKGHFAKMLTAASEVVMENRGMQYRTGNPEYVLMEFPHWCKFDESFPKGLVIEKSKLYNVHKINAVKLLDWLHEKGHSPYDSAMFVKQTKAFQYLDKQIDRMFEIKENEE